MNTVNTYHCKICDKDLAQTSMYQHLRSQKHVAMCNAQGKTPEIAVAKRLTKKYHWTCDICEKSIHQNGKDYHLRSNAHAQACKKKGIECEHKPETWYCFTCDKTLTKQAKRYHLKSKAHKRMVEEKENTGEQLTEKQK